MNNSLRITHYAPVCKRLPACFDGLEILHFSDVHLRGRPGWREEALLAELAEHPPDLLVFTGDMTNRARWWPEAEAWLRHMDGDFLRVAVPGNWEYYPDSTFEIFRRHAEAAGFHVLRNASLSYTREGETLALAGVDDLREGRPDPARALQGLPLNAFTIMLCHNPDIMLNLQGRWPDLLLCGHTHGGQIRLPGFGALYTSTRLGRRYAGGLYPLGEGHFLCVNRGMGTVGPALRLFCPPEIVRLRLRAGASAR